MNYTKGEWDYSTDGHYFYITAPDKPNRPRKGIAKIRDNNSEAVANAQLIAQAPRMYEALLGLLRAYNVTPEFALVCDYPSYWIDALNALPKAES